GRRLRAGRRRRCRRGGDPGAGGHVGSREGGPHQAGYEPFVQSIASDALAFMHPGYDVPNFHRVVVHGSTFPLEWLRLTIDPLASAPNGPNAFGPFSWTR